MQHAFLASLAAADTYEPETLAHAARVKAANGQGVHLPYVNQLVRWLKDKKLYSSVLAWWEPDLGTDLNGGQVKRLFSLDPAARDMTPVESYPLPILSAKGFAGLPELQFNSAVLGAPGFPLGPSQYLIAAVLHTPIVTGEPQILLGYAPDVESYINFSNAHGYIRASHVTGYVGAEIGFNDGSGTTYAGQPLRTTARWLANRSTPSELLVRANGVAADGYAQNTPRGPLSNAQRNKTFMLGGAPVYGALRRAADASISCCVVLNTEDASAAAALDEFLRQRYRMPS